jgi:predicted acetyltransferase
VPELLLRPLTVDDEAEARRAHEELAAEAFHFLLGGPRDGEPWEAYLGRLADERHGRDLPDGRVPSTFLVAELDGRLIARLSVRHELNEWLFRFGGHIGYGVRPAFRGLGHAGRVLRGGLVVAAAVGIDRALVVCDDDNAASAAVIERAGGVLENVVPGEGGAPLRRYWITTGAATAGAEAKTGAAGTNPVPDSYGRGGGHDEHGGGGFLPDRAGGGP